MYLSLYVKVFSCLCDVILERESKREKKKISKAENYKNNCKQERKENKREREKKMYINIINSNITLL